MKKVILCTAALSMMLCGAAYADGSNGQSKNSKDKVKAQSNDRDDDRDDCDKDDKKSGKKTGLENALERGKKSDAAREAIRRALEKKKNRHGIEWNDEKRVAADLAALKIGFTGTDLIDRVTGKLSLPVIGANGSKISWVSSKPEVITPDGQTVNRPTAGQGNVTVTLTATVSSGSVVKTKVFTLTVLQQVSDAQVVAADKAVLAVTYQGQDSAANVTQPVKLPATGPNGSVITWISSNPAVLSNNGLTVNRPTNGQGDVTLTLTATIRSGSVTEVKVFTLTVKQLLTDAQRVAADKEALAVGFVTGDTASAVTSPVVLPVKGANGSSIVWVSGNTAILSSDGKTVNRPAAGTGDAGVVLTAIITYGGVSDVKVFPLTVKQQLTDAQKVAADASVLAITYGGTDTASSVTKPLTLPVKGINGSNITWLSGNPAVVSNDGKTVNRPAAGQGDVSVNLTAILSAGTYTETKTFTVIIKQQLTDAQRVAADQAALQPIYAPSDSAASVTKNLVLSTVAPNGSKVLWISSDISAIAANGTVIRPAAGKGDANVILTAVISSGGFAETKSFQLIVKQLP